MAVYESHGRFYLSLPLLEGGRRKSLTLHPSLAKTRTAAEAREAVVVELLNKLEAAGQGKWALEIALQAAAADVTTLAKLRVYVEATLCTGLRKKRGEVPTFGEFSREWTSGRLAERFRDRVPKRDNFKKEVSILSRYVYPYLEDLPLTMITIEDLEAVLVKVPAELASTTRRHVAQTMGRVMRLAYYPAKHIETQIMPRGFLPLVERGSFSYLYPDEEARLVACPEVPLTRRLLYGFLYREGMRVSEAYSLRWSQIDLHRGAVSLHKHKTIKKAGPRTWMLDLGSRALLWWWRELLPVAPDALVFPGLPALKKMAGLLRRDLQAAGVTRPALFETSDGRHALRVHDLRASFVTLHLALGRSQAWISSRTGHLSWQTMKLYERPAREAADLELGPPAAFWSSVPECRAAYEEAMQGPARYAPRMRALSGGQKPRTRAANGEGFAVLPPQGSLQDSPENKGGQVIAFRPRIRTADPGNHPFPYPPRIDPPDPPREPHPLFLRLRIAVSNTGPKERRGLPPAFPFDTPSLLLLARLRRAA